MDKDLTSLRQELALMKQGLTSSRVGLPVDTVNARVKTATEAYTPGSEMLVLCDATDDAFTVTLPAISGSHKRMYTIKKTDSGANAVTVDGNDTETIDGAETYTLSSQYDYVTVIGGDSEWHIVGDLASAYLPVVYTSTATAEITRSATAMAATGISVSVTVTDKALIDIDVFWTARIETADDYVFFAIYRDATKLVQSGAVGYSRQWERIPGALNWKELITTPGTYVYALYWACSGTNQQRCQDRGIVVSKIEY